MAAIDRESGFVIDDKSYDIPTLDTLTLDEERILYLYADCVVQDFVSAHPDWSDEEKRAHDFLVGQRVRNPNLKRALAHIAYRREHPDVTDDEALTAIGKVNALELDLAMLHAGDDADPPAQTSQNELDRTTETSEPESPTGSGTPGEKSSDHQDSPPAATGTTESDTSNRGALQIVSAS